MYKNLSAASLLFADDVVILASSGHDLQHVDGVECEVAMVLLLENGELPPSVWE